MCIRGRLQCPPNSGPAILFQPAPRKHHCDTKERSPADRDDGRPSGIARSPRDCRRANCACGQMAGTAISDCGGFQKHLSATRIAKACARAPRRPQRAALIRSISGLLDHCGWVFLGFLSRLPGQYHDQDEQQETGWDHCINQTAGHAARGFGLFGHFGVLRFQQKNPEPALWFRSHLLRSAPLGMGTQETGVLHTVLRKGGTNIAGVWFFPAPPALTAFLLRNRHVRDTSG